MKATFELLDNEFEALAIRWDIQKGLFRSDHPDREAIFEWGQHAWHYLNRGLVDSMFIIIGRMMDPSKTGKKENLSLARMVELLPPGIEGDLIAGEVSAARAIYEAKIRPWRHWVIAHADLETAKDKSQLPKMPFAEFDELVGMLLEIGRDLHLLIRNVDVEYHMTFLYKNGPEGILDTMKRGVAAREVEIEERRKALNEKYGPLDG